MQNEKLGAFFYSNTEKTLVNSMAGLRIIPVLYMPNIGSNVKATGFLSIKYL